MQTVNFDTVGLTAGDQVLDLGCGEGRHVIGAYLNQDVHVVGVDLCFDDIKIAADKASDFINPALDDRQLSFSVGNALELPFADNTFDKVICSEVLEHIPDYAGALQEIERVLKPGGLFAASVPRFAPEWVCWALSDEYHANEGGHVRIFKEKQLRKDIEATGFRFFGRHWAHALHSPYWWLQCMFWDTKDNNPLVKAYHKLLVWDMMEHPKLTRNLERLLNPLIGKSVVMYFIKS